jgi:hypothetical protein
LLFLGAIFNTVNGSYDSFKIRKDEKELTAELEKELWHDLSFYEKYEFRNKLLLAETILKMDQTDSIIGKFKILEENIKYMEKEITEAESVLKKTNATKLDIATLAVNIQDLTLNTLKDMDGINKSTDTMSVKMEAGFDYLTKNVVSINNELNNYDRKFVSILESQKKLSDDIVKLKKIFTWISISIPIIIVVIFFILKSFFNK